MSDWIMLAIIVGFYPGVVLLVAITRPHSRHERRVMRTRRGLELKAKGGKLVHVRQTESEHEV